MLEKERKLKGKRILALVLTLMLCMGACVTVFAATSAPRKGELYGMDYEFNGWSKGTYLNGSTEADIWENGYSYVKVVFQKNLVDQNCDICVGARGNYVELCQDIKTTNMSNWRVHNSAKSKQTFNGLSLYAGAYSFY